MNAGSGLHPSCLPVEQLLRECKTVRTRRSGPGGQHRNKVESAIVLTHVPTGIAGQASERRSQAENLAMAIGRLRVALALGFRSANPHPELPSALWQERMAGHRVLVSPNHEDYPSLLAELLDHLAVAGYEASAVAQVRNCTASRLVRFLAKEPLALQHVNQEREKLGKKRLRS